MLDICNIYLNLSCSISKFLSFSKYFILRLFLEKNKLTNKSRVATLTGILLRYIHNILNTLIVSFIFDGSVSDKSGDH